MNARSNEIRRFKRAANTLAKLGNSGLFIYLSNDTLNLMSGPSHDDVNGTGRNPVPRRDRVLASVNIPNSGGGDW